MENPNYAATLASIQEAAERLQDVVHETPVITCSHLDGVAERSLFFKCENFQKVGAFKYRGASNAVMQLSVEQAAAGVVTHSSGNHAQALSLAAKKRGIPAWIVMPSNAPQVKRNAVAQYGGQIVLCEPTLVAREESAARIVTEMGACFIHPYDDAQIIAGQGTVALELLKQVDELDAIIAPVGGGGLLSGIAIAAKALRPSIQIIAAEPSGADDAWQSKQAGELVLQTAPDTIADGLLTSLGEHTWPVVRDLVDDVVLVNDDQICDAMRALWERAKIVVEPSGAVACAAACSEQIKADNSLQRVAVVVSGGNVNLDQLPWQI
ncbi:MAG: pyridoxal-phosphate dependent enzyme [Planctomycetota bacterium]|nr:pyridoxal-phosphate dependent enzyme [Planctomycetota bacterium]